MRIVVCIKSVPESTAVEFDLERGTMRREGVGTIINPFDMYAVEEGIRQAERHGGTVTALCMGPGQADRELREALAMGCDRAVLLSARAFAGADTLATAYTLAVAIRALGGADLVICGKQAIDGDTGQVGPGIAQRLGMVPLTYVSRIHSIDQDAGKIVVERLLEDGTELVEAPLPAVITVLKGINTPRYPTRWRLRAARRTQLEVWGLDELPQLDPERVGLTGSPTRVVRIFAPEVREGQVQFFDAEDMDVAAAALVERLIADRVVGR
ncbi:MAG: electron transfer flavoprotein subunit beta/FixA family protein [Anaerolineae bacterium]|nr:electron transfer flavoprotein subunit beta/FixA family protein [Chloroflexota bacterium]